MDWDQIDWDALDRLRAAFLEGSAGTRDYWQSERDLASYDLTFAQRIGWKWDYVLDELRRRSWTPPTGALLDWGCGSGIASRAFLDHFGTSSVARLRLWDRSGTAMAFASKRARAKYPDLPVQTGLEDPSPLGTLLVSHVLTELDQLQTDELIAAVENAAAILWVEPGNYEASRKLIAVRERLLRSNFQVVAPCPHQAACGMLLPQNQPHWCHHFASPPPEVFTDSNWNRFAKLAGIDLRSLPLSFLVLDRRPAPPLPAGTVRIIGRPRLFKPQAVLIGCDAGGIHEQILTRRAFPDEFRRLKKGQGDLLQIWESDSKGLVRLRPADPKSSR